ncbi:peptide chain release factor N(5)-glutamine methyltransferase [Kangiella taiwanensis]|uniref:Release factor glutamine methyltransferase n=1 Tax=Kangiella taiwanensis TaxID=1079179 RepID=A0ABP8I3S1_9GAMM|nr:peptide chain release factor N(5)-glutamine methyltransferase [Kangiella taiwanensis]
MSKTVQEALNWAVSELSLVDTAKLDAEVILAHALGQNRTWLKTWPDNTLSDDDLEHYQELVKRRSDGEPVAYITGKQDFWTLSLKVTTDTLIPRPETEHLVEFALSKIPQNDACLVADLGTGTGAIALSIASERPKATVWAMDISQGALAVAEHNRRQYALGNVTCHQSSWLDNWNGDSFDVIVSNPPYVEQHDPHLDSLKYEPITALVAEDKGLSDIKIIARQAAQHLKPSGWLMFEHGFEQGPAVRNILTEQGFVEVGTEQDYAGLDRMTFGRKAEL